MTALLLVHGRSQQMPMELDHSDEGVALYAAAKKRRWLAGLAKGLTLADEAPVAARDAYFPFYGNLLADAIAQHEAAGRRRPDLESTEGEREEKVAQHTADMLIDLAESVDFVASERMTSEEDAEAARRVEERRRSGDEAGISDVLKSKFARQALQFLADKTDSPEFIIERFLRDVAYYLEDDGMRKKVHRLVTADLQKIKDDGHEDVVIVGHSLGSVVAYDACTQDLEGLRVRLLVTAGSPLGLRVVRRNLWPKEDEGDETRPVPDVIEPVRARPGGRAVSWLNAFDVLDVVAMIHPLAPRFTGGKEKLRDERTHNPSGPHSIEDYLADPDVAGPIGRAMTAR